MATFDPDEPTRFGAWCDALGYPCASYGGLKVSQPSSSFICVPLVVGYVYFGIKILVENARKGTHWAWCDDHLADYVGTAHCRAERLPDAEVTVCAVSKQHRELVVELPRHIDRGTSTGEVVRRHRALMK